MDKFDTTFKLFGELMTKINEHSFLEQEIIVNRLMASLEEYAKRFPAYAIKVYKDIFGTLDREAGFSAEKKVILEVGPGYSAGTLFLAGLSGARKVCAVDAYGHPMGADNDFINSMYFHLMQDRSFFLTEARNLSDDEFTYFFKQFVGNDGTGQLGYRSERFEYHFPYFVEKLPYSSEVFDLVYSFAAFEHFRDPFAAACELYRIAKKGSISYHSVDLRDHRNNDMPFEFLTLSKEEWEKANAVSKSYVCTNRLRNKEIISSFSNAGFSLCKALVFQRATVGPALRARLHADYRDLSDDELSILGCVYIFKK